MAKHFKSKRRLRKAWIIEYVGILLFTYFLIKLCIYSLVDINPVSYLQVESIGREIYNRLVDNTINNPVILLNYKSQIQRKVDLLPAMTGIDTHPTDNPSSNKASVYIYNTHQQEGYATKGNVFNAADYFKEILGKQNISVTVEQGNIQEFLITNNYNYNYSYVASRYFLLAELEKNSHDLIIDLHRDAVSKNSSTVTIGDKSYAKILFVVGKEHDNYQKNYDLAKTLNDLIAKKYPNLTRGVLLKEGKNVNGIYNQDVAPNIILLELGGNYNTYEEAQNTIDLIAPIIGEYIHGQKI